MAAYWHLKTVLFTACRDTASGPRNNIYRYLNEVPCRPANQEAVVICPFSAL